MSLILLGCRATYPTCSDIVDAVVCVFCLCNSLFWPTDEQVGALPFPEKFYINWLIHERRNDWPEWGTS